MYRNLQLISFFTAFLALVLPDVKATFSQSLITGESAVAEECEETITWKFGTIDSRFDIDVDSLKTIAERVSDIWSEAAGYSVINYDPEGEVELNFYYTDQQRYTDDEQELSDRISRLRQRYYSQNVMYQRQENLFERKERLFNERQTEYNADVVAYNQTLNRIQTTGVRTRELDEQLKRLKREVEFQELELEILRNELHEQEQELQNLSEELNRRADAVNELVYQYQKRFSSWRTFYQGVYLNVGGKRKINIYQFDDAGRLTLVLAHEFGHALGIDHVGNPKSVMYYLTDRQDTRDLKLSEEDIRAFQLRCNL